MFDLNVKSEIKNSFNGRTNKSSCKTETVIGVEISTI